MPAALGELIRALEARGYAVVADERTRATTGNWYIKLLAPGRRHGKLIEILRDRGVWEESIDFDGQPWDPRRLLLELRGEPYTPRAESHVERVASMLALLEELDRLEG